MSIQALNWVFEQNGITNSGAKFVLTLLCNYADENGFAYPSIPTIADKTGIKERAVKNHLKWLAGEGFITRVRRRSDNKNASNLYQIQFDKTCKKDVVSVETSTEHSADFALCREAENLSADFAPSLESIVQIPSKHSADLVKKPQKHSADFAPYTKATKELTVHTQKACACESNSAEEGNFKHFRKSDFQNQIGIEPDKSDKQKIPFGHFRDEIEDWWCKLFNIPTLPPNAETAKHIAWLYDSNFTVEDVQGFYGFATTDPDEVAWRRGNVTIGAIVKGIAGWKTAKTANQKQAEDENKPSAISLCKLCNSRGMIEGKENGQRTMIRCDHGSKN